MVVVGKDGRIYDQFTGVNGNTRAEYLSHWDFPFEIEWVLVK